MPGPMPAQPTTARRVLRSKWLWIYLVLLGLSYAARLSQPGSVGLGDKQAETIPAFDRTGRATDATMRMAYLEWDGDPQRSHRPVILLHGSPGESDGFRRLGQLLAERGYRVLAPDLPGFGASTHTPPSLSIEANASAVWAWLDGLGVERVHLVPWSISGGTALRMAQDAPDRVASLTLMACIGSQRVEGSGDYFFEHLKYGFGDVALVQLGEVIPGVAAIPRWFRRSFIRSFWEIDQRPLERIMRTTRVPTLILHGRRDVLVAVRAAEYNHEIMPASRLVMLDATHMFPVLEPQIAVPWLVEQFEQTERGEPMPAGRIDLSPTRRSGPVTRAIRWAQAQLGWAHWTVQALAIAVLALLMPELAFVLVGFLVADTTVDYGVAVAGMFAGVALRRGRSRPGRLLVRAPGWFITTIVHLAVVLIVLGAGPIEWWDRLGVAGLIPALVVAAWAWIIVSHLWSWRSRQLLKGRLAGLIRHEFWPPWLLYAPLVPWLVWLAIRHRGAMVFSCVNPGIAHGGGIAGESKIAILQALAPAGDAVLAGRLIPAGASPSERAAMVRALVAQDPALGGLPIVLKPDSSEHGIAVRIARTDADIDDYFNAMTRDAIVQRYHPGPGEVGVLWARVPREGSTLAGRVWSITRKVFPRVIGDGAHTLEQLILRDRRLRCQGRIFLERFAHRLDEIPDRGETIVLSSTGNHIQGTMFCDGIDLLTPALEARIDAIASAFVGGLDYGRFDIRYETDEALGRSEGLGIVELNGTLAESTNLYDPGYSVVRTYRVLCGQWAMLYRLGAQRRAAGARPMSLVMLVRSVLGHHLGSGGSRVAG